MCEDTAGDLDDGDSLSLLSDEQTTSALCRPPRVRLALARITSCHSRHRSSDPRALGLLQKPEPEEVVEYMLIHARRRANNLEADTIPGTLAALLGLLGRLERITSRHYMSRTWQRCSLSQSTMTHVCRCLLSLSLSLALVMQPRMLWA